MSSDNNFKFAQYEGITMIGFFLVGMVCFFISVIAYNNYIIDICDKKVERSLMALMILAIAMVVIAITYSSCAYKYDCTIGEDNVYHLILLFVLSVIIFAISSDTLRVVSETSDCNGEGQNYINQQKGKKLKTTLGNMITFSVITAIMSAGGIAYTKWDLIKEKLNIQ